MTVHMKVNLMALLHYHKLTWELIYGTTLPSISIFSNKI